jgi:hypothetical protein
MALMLRDHAIAKVQWQGLPAYAWAGGQRSRRACRRMASTLAANAVGSMIRVPRGILRPSRATVSHLE